MARVCPWRHAYLFDNALRRLFHNPRKLFAPYLGEGMTALDIGCGMGFFSIGMARLVGDGGRVIAADLQPEMLEVLMRRARRKGVAGRIQPHKCDEDSIGVAEQVDFALAFWMVHEVPDQALLAQQVRACLKPGGRFFVAEPKGHVSRDDLRRTITLVEGAGMQLVGEPRVRLSRAAVFEAGVETSG